MIGRGGVVGRTVAALACVAAVVGAGGALGAAAAGAQTGAGAPTGADLQIPLAHRLGFHAGAVGEPGADARPASARDAATSTSPVAPFISRDAAGYVETGTTFTSVGASWTVPTAGQAGSSPAGLAVLVSVGALTATTGLVIGTSEAYVSGNMRYLAFWAVSTTTPARTTGGHFTTTMAAGDVVQASVHQVSGSSWTLSLTDETQGWTQTKAVSYGGTTTCDQWLGIALSTDGNPLPLVDFQHVTFEGLSETAANPAAGKVTPVFMDASRTGPIHAYPVAASFAPLTPFTITEGAPPAAISFLTPSFGTPAGGNLVEVYGTWLMVGGKTTVDFGPNTDLTVTLDKSSFTADGRTILAVVAPGGTGQVQVKVNTVGGPASGGSGAQYTFGTPKPAGYDLVGADGGVFVFDPAGVAGQGFYGSLPQLGVVPNKPVVGMVPTLSDQGYFLVASDGGVFAFGNAPFLGSLPGLKVTPNAPIVGIVAANTDKGYFLVGKDGGVFAFGTVPYLGSLPGSGVVTDNVVGIAATPTGSGYWLVTKTGTVYAYGAAKTLGSVTGTTEPVTAIAGTPTGGGYWVTTANGNVHAFGNAGYFGTLAAIGVTPAQPVIGVVHTAGTAGYWLIGADGGIFAFGLAPFAGSLPGDNVHVTDIVAAVPITT